MDIQSRSVREKRQLSYIDDFPYKHPRVSIGKEIEPAVNVFTIKNALANLGIRKAFVCSKSEEPVSELSSSLAIKEISSRKKRIKRVGGHVLDLVTPGANLYSHWLLDLLPKVDAVKRAGFSWDDFDYVYVNYFNSRFKKESFDKLGIPASKVLDFPSSPKIFSCDKVTTVTSCRHSLYTPDWVDGFVNSVFLDKNKRRALGEGKRRIYISRSKGNTRRILNEAQLLELIIPYGFETLYCEDHSVSDVSRIMSEAELIIAPHGAGLANSVFCNSDIQLIELFSSHISSEYYKLSKKRGVEYHCIQTHSPDGSYIDVSKLDYNDREVIHPMNLLLSRENLREIQKLLERG
ncbi:glycosyltransferase family 61 protein [Halomonas caseinilytica]|uniref:glycosyltransferase family 61 protein n=1 Tax=Halomonas caseinilytica TaxID=438744 RepID=UPI0008C3EC97|nr:glycosyltransferase family 61 protein [Halomonas caseinilytica]SEN44592.1 Protein of unknown function [Halomonas caseinilytica]